MSSVIADDLYCGGNTLDELLSNWKRVLDALQKSNLKLSPSKTVICPRSTTILGWIWTQGVLSASPHRVAVLAKCPLLTLSVGYALLSALIRFSVEYYQTALPILPDWKVQLLDIRSKTRLFGQMIYSRSFIVHKKALCTHKSIMLPRADDQIWIVTDGSVTRQGIGATMYVSREN